MVIGICVLVGVVWAVWIVFHKLHLHVQQCVDHGTIAFDGHRIQVSQKAGHHLRPMLTQEIRVLAGLARIIPGVIKLTPGKVLCYPNKRTHVAKR
ncbi:hypothetical protein [Candidatus Sororendozoicomonas aggregata]|uniref:hypothetical protein n=1 Tax=Candidatus Sororendozoicomonas aggregata TaxID=3073239 RepID=UPI002ED30FF0